MFSYHAKMIQNKRPDLLTRFFLLALAFAPLFVSPPTRAADASTSNPLTAPNLDGKAFSQWVDGKESPPVLPPNDAAKGAGIVVWTDKSGPIHTGVTFGESGSTGLRHLRIGFREPVTIGSIMVRGGGKLSVLKATSDYPGDLANDQQWLSAERVSNGSVSQSEVGRDEYAMWVLPRPTPVRALRFSHEAAATDKTYAGWLGGIRVFEQRLANLAPFALASSNLDTGHPEYLIDGKQTPPWERFDSHDKSPARPQDVVSESNPAWVMLVWPKPVTLRGFAALSLGAITADVQVYAGPQSRHPREAHEEDWHTVRRFEKLDPEYPRTLPLRWLDFGGNVTSRAVKLRMLQPVDGRKLHPHLHDSDQGGRRVWIGELMALSALDEQPLAQVLPPAAEQPHPPIPIHFKLAEAGYVTLTIDDAKQRRVRNLLSETLFPAGENTAWWDGLDDLGRDPDAARHGLYNVPGSPVALGDYQVHGIWHKDVNLRYEFSVYTAGDPAWNTEDKTGAWLANHTPPQAALFVPASHGPDGKAVVYLGSYVSEGTHGLAWVDLDGKKLGGINWVGGNWTGAPFLAGDASDKSVPGVYAYVGSVWQTEKNSPDLELRLTAITSKGERPVLRHAWHEPFAGRVDDAVMDQMAGLAARAGWLYVSLRKQGKILIVDARKTDPAASDKTPSGSIAGSLAVKDPRGVAIDSDGKLLVISGRTLRRYELPEPPGLPVKGTVVIKDGLDDPQGIALDWDGHIYISDHGASHQVKVFDAEGRFMHAIGHQAAPKAGPYDEQQMRRPMGLTVDNLSRLWVTECSDQPKRVSLWKTDGTFLRAFYGPSEYGGGGTLDSHDASQFHYHGMTFSLDWKKGGFALKQIYYPGAGAQPLAFRSNFPEAPVYRDGRRFWHNSFNSNPTGGQGTAFVFVDRDGIAIAAAGCGRAGDWETLKTDAFRDRWPTPKNPREDRFKQPATFVWSDLNGDGHVQPDEVTITAGQCGGVTVMDDLAIVISRLDGKAMRVAVQRFTDQHVPVYDLSRAEVLAEGVEGPKSSGGDQALVHPDGWTILSLGVAPYSPYSLCGAYRGQVRWAYPNPWPGLHASHEAPVPDHPGELIGPTRLLGGWIEPKGSDAGPLWFINANMGNIYVFTADGMFVRTLFHDSRTGKPWAMPKAQRGMLLNDVTLHDENFWPTVAQTPAGEIFLQDGGRSSLVRVEGLETLRRLPAQTVHIGETELQAALAWRVQVESERQREQGNAILSVELRAKPPTIDGKLDDWSSAQWASIDRRGTKANFNSNSKPYDVSAALAVADGRLFAAFRTGDKDLLKNSGEQPLAPFKTGGALDLMLATDPTADPKRARPAPGDLRLLVTMITDPAGKAPPRRKALLYRAAVPGTAAKDRIPFSSPWRTIYFDRVDDVSDQVQLAGQDGNYEFSIPLETLGLKITAGLQLKGDLGVLRGNGFQTHYRVYWTNKATAITADVPSEAELLPSLWGVFNFK
jgi:hypothetical protein